MSEEIYTITCTHCDQDITVTKHVHDAQTILKSCTPEEIHKNCPKKPN